MLNHSKKIAILLTNTGTPDVPTSPAVRRYLREFLSDKRIVQLPRWLWLPILYGIILPFRPQKSAQLYQKIWQKDSPLRGIMQELQAKLTSHLAQEKHRYVVEIGMNYGNPSIASALDRLQKEGIDTLITIPLFPQYSNTTTASSYDRVDKELKKWTVSPHRIFIRDYHDDATYLDGLHHQIEAHWRKNGRRFLLFSFHGMPKRFITKGDIYQEQCENTTQLLANKLGLAASEWDLSYQSQFGYDKWLQPATENKLRELAKTGVMNVDILCPGFAIDCLETLEEIQIRAKHVFKEAGGKELRYLPALNASDEQVRLLTTLIQRYS